MPKYKVNLGPFHAREGIPRATSRFVHLKNAAQWSNKVDPLPLDNFTIAHELGHYFMHTDYSGTEELVHTRRGSNRREWEANWFAAALLMPASEFRSAAAECDNDEICLARKFGVSSAAASVRLNTI